MCSNLPQKNPIITQKSPKRKVGEEGQDAINYGVFGLGTPACVVHVSLRSRLLPATCTLSFDVELFLLTQIILLIQEGVGV